MIDIAWNVEHDCVAHCIRMRKSCEGSASIGVHKNCGIAALGTDLCSVSM